MGRLIDTDVLITLERSGLSPEEVIAAVSGAEPIGIASITVSELLVGAHRAGSEARRLRREAFVEGIVEQIPVLPFDTRVARVHAAIWAHLAARGQLIGSHDLLIAATALSHEYGVLTYNVREFERVPGLAVSQPAW